MTVRACVCGAPARSSSAHPIASMSAAPARNASGSGIDPLADGCGMILYKYPIDRHAGADGVSRTGPSEKVPAQRQRPAPDALADRRDVEDAFAGRTMQFRG